MAFGNGYDVDKVLAALRPRIGWKAPKNGLILTGDNLASVSKRHYEEFHGSVTVAGVKAVNQYSGLSDADFNAELSSLKDSIILAALTAVFSKPQTLDEPASFFERVNRTIYASIANGAAFVGRRVEVARTNYAGIIHGVEFLLDADATFKVYVFSEFGKAPIYSQEVTCVGDDLTEVIIPDWVLKPGAYYIGYFQQDLGARQGDPRHQPEQWPVHGAGDSRSFHALPQADGHGLSGLLFRGGHQCQPERHLPRREYRQQRVRHRSG